MIHQGKRIHKEYTETTKREPTKNRDVIIFIKWSDWLMYDLYIKYNSSLDCAERERNKVMA
jgi:hypothetical protein